MKLILHELSKRSGGRILWLVMALLVLLNVLFCFRETEEDYNPRELAALKAADEIAAQVPEEIYLYYQTMLSAMETYEKENEEWNFLYMEAMGSILPFEKLPPEPHAPDFPSTYYEKWDDFSLLERYYQNVITSDGYETAIKEKRQIAEDTVNAYRKAGYDKNSYAYRYQVRFWNIYGDALETVKSDGRLTYGWDAFWKYDGSGIFLMLAAILIGSRLFTVERDSGMESLLRTARRGRGQLALSKLGCAALKMLGISLLFHLAALLTCTSRFGLSSPFAAIQQSPEMLYCPYPFSQLGAFLLTVLISALAALVICLLTAMLTLLFKRSLPALAVSVVVVGIEFVLLEVGGEYFTSINLLTATNALRLWERWLPIHFMGSPQSFLPILIVVLAVLALPLAMITLERWVHRGMGESSAHCSPQARYQVQTAEAADASAFGSPVPV